MRRFWIVLGLPILLMMATAAPSAAAPQPLQTTVAAKSSGAPTTLPITTVPPTSGSFSVSPTAPTGTILMIKLYVGNLVAAQKFYGAVFGAKLAITMGSFAHIVTFPKGGTGLVLLKKGVGDKNKVGGFIIEVPNLKMSVALAKAHGAKIQGKFAGTPANQAAQSVDTLDPWGNNVEILQVG